MNSKLSLVALVACGLPTYNTLPGMDGWVLHPVFHTSEGLIGQQGTMKMRRFVLLARDEMRFQLSKLDLTLHRSQTRVNWLEAQSHRITVLNALALS